ncbi:MAG TPA: lipopolysaccharide heptosyltransferase family protein [Arcobacter sp.]|nr:lipopolysaccharide heptosyltransferase family protein [Arcobacter sp.]
MIDITNKKILLVRNDNIGDLICTTPAIEALRKKYPNNQIDIVVNTYNYDAIHKNPFVNKIYCYTKPKHKPKLIDKIKAGLGKLKILIDIRKENYDVVVIFRSGYSKSASLFANITNAAYKVGVKNLKGKDNFNMHTPVNNKKHEVEFCFDCLKEFGIEHNKENTFFYVPQKYTEKYIQYNDYILLHISSRRKANKYATEKFKSIIDALDSKKILITAEPDDFKNAQLLDEQTAATFIQTSSLLDLSGLIQNIKLFVTLDGGAMHVAPALGIKTISISGETNMDKWYPWGYKELIIQDDSKIAENIDNNLIVNKIKKLL